MLSKRGISLLEVLVAVSVMAVLAGVALQGYRHLRSRLLLNAAARQIVLDLKVARMRAIAEAATHRLHFSVPGTTYQRERKGTGRRYRPVGPPTPLPPTIEIIGCTAVGSGVGFRPRGHASTFGTVTLRNVDGEHLQIVTDIAGRMRVR